MTVFFIGAGPGAADLLTQRAVRLIARCGTTLYAGSIVPQSILSLCPPMAKTVNTAKMPLSEIIDEIKAADDRGDDVARLHSGDPSLYSAVAEQARALDDAGIEWQIVPGVPAYVAAAAALRQELTVPGVSQTVHLTRVDGRATAMPDGEDLATVCASGGTAVIHLAAAQLERVATELAPIYGEQCPAAVVAFASRADEVIVRGPLRDIPSLAAQAGIDRTAVVIVGKVLANGAQSAEEIASFLYSDDRPRDADGRTVCADQNESTQAPTPAAPAAPPIPTEPLTPVAPTAPSASGPHTAAATPAGESASPAPSAAAPSRPATESAHEPHDEPAPLGRILILGGTSEGRHLADRLDTAGIDVVTSLAGRVSRPRTPRGDIRIGGFGGPEGLARWLSDNEVSAVIDATHPFAEKISASAMAATAETGTPILRLHRREWEPEEGDNWIRVQSLAEAATVVRERFVRPMLTIGRQGLHEFSDDNRGSYLIRCVEPPTGDMPANYLLVLDRGPFGLRSERALMSRHRIDVLVTKNSGGSDTEPKLEAARELRIPVIVVDRPAAPRVDTVNTVDEAAQWIVRRFGRRG